MIAVTRPCRLLPVFFLLFAACAPDEKGRKQTSADASAPIWPLSTKSEEARRYFELGERAGDEDRRFEAGEQFKRAVAADSAFALGYLKISEYANSIDEYRLNLQRAEAYKGTANETEKLLIEMWRKSESRDLEWALALAKQLVAKHPSNPRSYWVLALQQRDLGQMEESRESLRKAAELAPSYGASRLAYGADLVLAPKNQDLAKAEQEILAGLKVWPDQPMAFDFLGDLRRAQGRLQEAAAAYTRQIELDPKGWQGHQQLGHVHTFLGEHDKARSDYTAAMRLGRANEPAIAARYRAFSNVYAGQPKKSLPELEELYQAIDGMNIPEPEGIKTNVLTDLATIAMHIGEFEVAEKAVLRGDSLQKKIAERGGRPENKRDYEAGRVFWQGRLAAFKGDHAVAAAKASEHMKIVEPEKNPTKNWSAHSNLAFSAFFQKRYEDALKEFEQAGPPNVYQKYFKARALEELGRAADAKVLYKEIATYNFNNALYALVRGDAVARSK